MGRVSEFAGGHEGEGGGGARDEGARCSIITYTPAPHGTGVSHPAPVPPPFWARSTCVLRGWLVHPPLHRNTTDWVWTVQDHAGGQLGGRVGEGETGG